MEVRRGLQGCKAYSGLPAGSRTFFLLLQNGSVFPGACRGLDLRPLTCAAIAAWDRALALEMGKGKERQGSWREGRREAEPSLSLQRHLLGIC